MRIEKDSIGELELEDVYYGIHSKRAIGNFQIRGRRVNKELLRAIGLIKICSAEANKKAGKITDDLANIIKKASTKFIEELDGDIIPLSCIQGGAGTSTNMYVNEVVANLGLELMDQNKGNYELLDPLNHVNLSQSTNDVYPTALKIAGIKYLRELLSETMALQEALQGKEREFSGIYKIGRTQLQDAVPLTLGQEFGAYAEAISRDRWRLYKIEERLRRINIGGTAIGTGVGASGKYKFYVTEELQRITGLGLARAENLIDVTQNLDVFIEVHSLIKTMASNLNKIAKDLRLMSSQPFGEIKLKPLQAGSSIMPGKVNPVGCELIQQIFYKICGNDTTLTIACSEGEFELNAMTPIIAEVFLESLEILTDGVKAFRETVIKHVEANKEKCSYHLEKSTSKITLYIEKFGYEKLVEILKESEKTGVKVEDIINEKISVMDKLK